MASPFVFVLLSISQTPDYAKSIEALQQAYRATPLPEILLSIAATYEVWPEHCNDAVSTYAYFFETCDGCAELRRGLDRFDLAIERCISSADEEAALREQYLVPSRRPPPKKAGDASRGEVVALLRRARALDRTEVNRAFVTLIEAGMDAPVDELNQLRERAWSILSKVDADAEQVLALIARIKDVDPVVYRTVLDAMVDAERSDDQAALNAVRARAIDVLRANTSPAAPPREAIAGCTANPAYELGYLTVGADPWAEVYVNGEKVGSTPISRHEVVAGCATVRAVSPVNGKERITNVTVRPNRVSIVKLDLSR